jgi:hypothetical protein
VKGVTCITRNGTSYWYARVDNRRRYVGKDNRGKELAEEMRAEYLVERKRKKKAGLLKEIKQNGGGRYIYFIQEEFGGNIKIGVANDPEKRLANLQSANPKRLKIVGRFEAGKLAERLRHKMFGEFRLEGEWFSPEESLTSYILDLLEGKV